MGDQLGGRGSGPHLGTGHPLPPEMGGSNPEVWGPAAALGAASWEPGRLYDGGSAPCTQDRRR